MTATRNDSLPSRVQPRAVLASTADVSDEVGLQADEAGPEPAGPRDIPTRLRMRVVRLLPFIPVYAAPSKGRSTWHGPAMLGAGLLLIALGWTLRQTYAERQRDSPGGPGTDANRAASHVPVTTGQPEHRASAVVSAAAAPAVRNEPSEPAPIEAKPRVLQRAKTGSKPQPSSARSNVEDRVLHAVEF